MNPLPSKIMVISIVIMICASIAGFLFKRPALNEPVVTSKATAVDAVLTETDWNDYIWPTDASRWMTSNFCEFRANHFHAGIDVSTNMQEGYNVFAARDGWLHEIRFEPHGYGWFQIVRHADGFYTCNAHLKGFPKRILHAYRLKQLALGKSYGTVAFDKGEVPVKKGEVIAFTGATGAGPPHLHFEIRDAQFNPVNPCLAKNLRIKDSIAPQFSSIMLEPLDALSTINGKAQRLFLTSASTSKNEPLQIRGRVGIYVKAIDRAEEAKDSFTPYSLELFLGARRHFASVFNRVQDSLYWHIRIDRDHELMKSMKGEYRKLFREEGNRLSVYEPNISGAGVLSASSCGTGKKTVRLVASDISGNKTSVQFDAVVLPEEKFSVAFDETRGAVITSDGESSIRKFEITQRTSRGDFSAASEFVASTNTLTISRDRLASSGIIRVRGIDTSGYPTRPVFIVNSSSVRSAEWVMKRQVLNDEIVFSITSNSPFTKAPVVVARQGDREANATVIASEPNEYIASLRLWNGFSGTTSIKITADVGGNVTTREDEFSGTLVSAANGGVIRSEDGAFAMTVFPFGVVRSLFCSVIKRGADTATAYSVYPQDIPISGIPEVRFSSHAGVEKRFIRSVHAAIPLRQYPTRFDALNSSYATRSGYYFANYFLFTDTSSPLISLSLSRRKQAGIIFTLTDPGSGIDAQTIKVSIDGTLVNAEYSERSRTYYVPAELVPVKRKEVTVEVCDRVGNKAVLSRKF